MNIVRVKAKDLRLADTVRCYTALWNFAIVKNIKDGQVTLFRPYGTTEGFSFTGGVICYIGIEEFEIPANDDVYEVLERKTLK